MTFAARTAQGSSQGGPVGFSLGVSNNSAATGIRGGSCAMLGDGTTTSTVHGTGNVVGSPWYAPAPTTGIGASYWVKLTITSSSGTTVSGAVGSIVSLSGGTSWSFTSTGAITEGTGSGTFDIYADAGGTQRVGGGSVSWDVGYTP